MAVISPFYTTQFNEYQVEGVYKMLSGEMWYMDLLIWFSPNLELKTLPTIT